MRGETHCHIRFEAAEDAAKTVKTLAETGFILESNAIKTRLLDGTDADCFRRRQSQHLASFCVLAVASSGDEEMEYWAGIKMRHEELKAKYGPQWYREIRSMRGRGRGRGGRGGFRGGRYYASSVHRERLAIDPSVCVMFDVCRPRRPWWARP